MVDLILDKRARFLPDDIRRWLDYRGKRMNKTRVEIPEHTASQWGENYFASALQYEIDREIIQSISGKLPPDIDDDLHYLPVDMRKWLEKTGTKYEIVISFTGRWWPVAIDFEDKNIATQFSITWL